MTDEQVQVIQREGCAFADQLDIESFIAMSEDETYEFLKANAQGPIVGVLAWTAGFWSRLSGRLCEIIEDYRKDQP